MVGEDRLRDLLQQDGLAGPRRGHDEPALAPSDGRDHVERPHGQLIGGGLELQLLVRLDRGEAFEEGGNLRSGGGARGHRPAWPLPLSWALALPLALPLPPPRPITPMPPPAPPPPQPPRPCAP